MHLYQNIFTRMPNVYFCFNMSTVISICPPFVFVFIFDFKVSIFYLNCPSSLVTVHF